VTPQEERNVAVVRRSIDGATNSRDLDGIDERWADDLRWNGGSLGSHSGREAFKAFAAANASGAWQDMRLEVDEIVAGGDKVVARFTNCGTNIGPFMNTPATGKQVEWLGSGINSVRDSRITEGWFAEDILGTLQQLGALRAP